MDKPSVRERFPLYLRPIFRKLWGRAIRLIGVKEIHESLAMLAGPLERQPELSPESRRFSVNTQLGKDVDDSFSV
jgi:hypothetical protein